MTINDTDMEHPTVFRLPKTESRAYKKAVKEEVEGQRDKRYRHLPAKYWTIFLASCLCLSAGLWSEGSPPGHLKRYVMDLERAPGLPLPQVCQPSRHSAAELEKERHHLYREMN